ncbi:hypothetical protein ACFW2T_33075 [Streptomyces sp. NPDC058892]|uniref:hypothetical protein n=1 Tax=unclassified Streptomyces TaxID=2593676 RepID=UPI0036C16AC9
MWLAIALVSLTIVGGLVYLGYQHPSLVAPVGLGLTGAGLLVSIVKWVAGRR